jgi:hypothetical protein
MERKSDLDGAPRGDGVDRREFLHGAVAGAAAFALTNRFPLGSFAPQEDPVLAQIPAQHDATLQMLRDWIALPSIAAEGKGYPEGPEHMAKLARDAGFDHV